MRTRTAIALMLACALPLAATQATGKGKKVARDYANTIATLQTDMGDIQIKFFYDKAPKHVENFIDLAASGFYDGTLFHRVIPGFMIQGGDPNTKKPEDPSKPWGTGGNGSNRVKAEFNDTSHKRGIVSMARAADPNSASSQFFIVVKDSTFLDGQYSAFGEVVSGMEVADKIAAAPRGANDRPNQPIHIKKVLLSQAKRATELGATLFPPDAAGLEALARRELGTPAAVEPLVGDVGRRRYFRIHFPDNRSFVGVVYPADEADSRRRWVAAHTALGARVRVPRLVADDGAGNQLVEDLGEGDLAARFAAVSAGEPRMARARRRHGRGDRRDTRSGAQSSVRRRALPPRARSRASGRLRALPRTSALSRGARRARRLGRRARPRDPRTPVGAVSPGLPRRTTSFHPATRSRSSTSRTSGAAPTPTTSPRCSGSARRSPG